ncbi:unnamed protein product [Rotaria magnacalcarata]|uniref:Reverse transcriptase domain-containing protein n=1 Tax=Rotaria magnacalcarata TaxID=392030 RepID=A0A8S2LYP0_9BILA|nr:unnamed protein product [Rotaria magnacalcarata]CAF3924606.1 unnamed protein product [Rotaria magnacalcarata]
MENMPIKDKHGKLILNSTDQLERWREFFDDLLNVSTVVDLQLIDQIKIKIIEKNDEERQNMQPTISEVRKALNQMKSRKDPGNDEITADLLKAGGEPVIKWLHEIFSDVWKQEEMVGEWNLAILIKLFKKGDKQLCDNYRGTSLLSVTSKLFSRIILNRIQLLVNRQLLEAQSGFRSNRSTIDRIFILKLCMEKRREFNKPLFMCFIDITKAYDSVNRELLWKICRQYGISEKLVNLLKMLHTNSKAKVKVNGEFSDSFEINNGVMQGGIPSPILFNILFDFIIRKVIEEADVTGVQFSYGRNDFFHDDVVAMCETSDDLEIFIETFEKITQEYGLSMNVKKTCIMTLKQLKVDQNNNIIHNHEVDQPYFDINIRNQKVETVNFFTYLGCGVSRDQKPDEGNQHKCLRIIIGVNLGDRMSNDKILEITGQPPIETIIHRNRLRWFGHANRMMNSDNEPSVVKKITFSYFPEEKRPGNNGIRKRWEDKVKEDIEHCQIKNWRKDSLNRDHWRELINKNVQNRPVHQNIKEIIYEYKRRAVNGINYDLAASHGVTKIKVTEVLVKNTNNHYVCPGCGIQFKPQGITNHVKACVNAQVWCKSNKIK